MQRALYTLIVFALLPLTPLYLWWRGRRQAEYRQHWRERFALYPSPANGRDDQQTIWLHAVSVGETRAAQPLVNAIRQRWPRARIVFTHMTPTGRATALALYGDTIESMYLPYDTPGGVRRFLAKVRPQLGLIIETELWPNLLAACKQLNVPTLLVNARLSEKSANSYRRFAALSAQTLNCLQHIGAQSLDDAQRLRSLGATRITVTGNLKFDIDVPPAQRILGAQLRQRWGERPVLLCASTREGEEQVILDAWSKLGAGGTASVRPLLLIVPRHPQRFDDVASLVLAKGLHLQRRSDNCDIAKNTDVVLGDSMGEMFAYYTSADLAFIGGSLLEYGCQNLIEPCAVGTPVLIGPSTYNFTEAASAALSHGAAEQISSADALVKRTLELFVEPQQLANLSAAGGEFIKQHQGASARTMALVEAAYKPLPS